MILIKSSPPIRGLISFVADEDRQSQNILQLPLVITT